MHLEWRLVRVVPAYPRHGPGQVVLIPALGREIKQLVCAVNRVKPAAVGRIGMKDLALIIEREHAQAWRLLGSLVYPPEVVLASVSALLGRGRDAEVEVEVPGRRGVPAKRPAHAPPIRLDFTEWRSRDGDERSITVC